MIVNVARHVHLVHPDSSPVKSCKRGRKSRIGTRQYKGRKECSVCGSTTIRMDIHLKSVHKFLKDSDQYKEAMAESKAYAERTQAADDLHRALVDYR